MVSRRATSRVVMLGLALALVSSGLTLMESDAAWRRVTRNFQTPFVNDLQVCTDGIEFRLGLTLQPTPPSEDPEPVDPPEPPPETFPREALRVTTGATEDGQPAGVDLLLLEQGWGDPMPQVPQDDVRLDGFTTNPDRTVYLVEDAQRWTSPIGAATTVHIWLLLGGDTWRSANEDGVGSGSAEVPVGQCEVFGPSPVSVRFDANAADVGNTLYPELLDVTIFEVSGADVDPASLRFGAPGRERPAYAVKVDGRIYGIADLRARGLGCDATTASVTGHTVDGEPFAATDAIHPICK